MIIQKPISFKPNPIAQEVTVIWTKSAEDLLERFEPYKDYNKKQIESQEDQSGKNDNPKANIVQAEP